VTHSSWGEHRVRAVAIGEAPDAAPALQRAERSGQNAAHPSEPARRGVVVFGASEWFVEEPGECDVTSSRNAFCQGTGVRAAARQTPGTLKKLRMIHVEMVINVVVNRARRLIRDESCPGARVAD